MCTPRGSRKSTRQAKRRLLVVYLLTSDFSCSSHPSGVNKCPAVRSTENKLSLARGRLSTADDLARRAMVVQRVTAFSHPFSGMVAGGRIDKGKERSRAFGRRSGTALFGPLSLRGPNILLTGRERSVPCAVTTSATLLTVAVVTVALSTVLLALSLRLPIPSR